MGAKSSKQEPVRMYNGEAWHAAWPSPSTRLPPRYYYSSDHQERAPWEWEHSRPPYLNRRAIPAMGDTSGFHDGLRHATLDQSKAGPGSVPQGSCATTLTGPVPEDELRMLRGYDIVFMVDDTYSVDLSGRWEQARRALSQLADLAGQYDEDGIDIYFLGNRAWGAELKDATSVEQVFSSLKGLYGMGHLARRIHELLQNYIGDMNNHYGALKPVNVIILLKCVPFCEVLCKTGDKVHDDVATVIRHFAKVMDDSNYPLTQIGIHFVQVGNRERTKKYLQALDDDLNKQGGIRDFVDFTPSTGDDLTAEGLLKILLASVKRRVEKQKLNVRPSRSG